MAKPARREGTPAHKNRKNQSNRGSTNAQRNRSRRDSGAKVETSNVHAKDIYVSNARPARHQHVDSDRRGSGKRVHSEAGEGVRLQKVLAQAGVASRRMAEKLIDEGRVEVDGKIVTRQGVRVDPNTSVIRVACSRPCTMTWAARVWATSSVRRSALVSDSSTWDDWMRPPRGCCCSPTMVSWPTV